MKLRNIIPALLLSAMTILSGCGEKKEIPTPTPAETDTTSVKTVLAYLVAENSLGSALYLGDDMNEMLMGVMTSKNMTPNDNFILYVDDTKLPRIYNITTAYKDSSYLSVNLLTPEYTFPTDCNSASPEQLKAVMDYVVKHHPSDTYSAVFASHASGWIEPPVKNGNNKAKNRSFGLDNGHNQLSDYGDEMAIEDMANVLKQYKKMDFILFDACFMQCVEVDYMLKDVADYIIASPAEIPGYGADYATLVDYLCKSGEEAAKDIAKRYVDTYLERKLCTSQHSGTCGAIMSTVKTSMVEPFAAYMKTVVDAHKDALLAVVADESHMDYFLFDGYYRNRYPDYFDIQYLMNEVMSDEELAQFHKEIDKIVIAKYNTDYWWTVFGYSDHRRVKEDEFGGMSMFIPMGKYARYGFDYAEQYMRTVWGQKVWGAL